MKATAQMIWVGIVNSAGKISSNHRRVKIYFDPEYLQLYEDAKQGGLENNRDLNLFDFASSNEGGSRKAAKYKLQILNVDLQQSKIIDIVIADKRSG